MIAVGAGRPIDEGEHVVSHESLKEALPMVCAGNLVGELRGHRFEAARRQHEGDRFGIFTAKSLFGEIREDVAREAGVGEGMLDGAEVGPVEGATDEDEAGRPALGEACETFGLAFTQARAAAPDEEFGDLPGIEA